MTPPPAPDAARQPAPAPRRVDAAPRQPLIEVVEQRQQRRQARRRRLLPVLSALLVSGSLLTVVVGHSLLAQNQVRLATVQAQITRAQTVQRSATVAVGQLENPTRIEATAIGELHMSDNSQVVQLPYVSLSTPVATPHVTAPPPPPSATTGSTAGNTTTAGKNAPSTTSSSASPGQ